MIKAQWFAELWQRFGFTEGVHLRRIHYRIVRVKPRLLKPDGWPYENTEGCWDFLSAAGKYARYLGLVDAHAFEDHRNPAPHLYMTREFYRSERSVTLSGWMSGSCLQLKPILAPCSTGLCRT